MNSLSPHLITPSEPPVILAEDKEADLLTYVHMIIDQRWLIELASDRQRYIDQGQSVNLFFPANVSVKYLHSVHFLAWKSGLKSLYYLRSEKVKKADKVGAQIKRQRIEDEIDLKQIADGDTCLACEG